VTKNAIIIISDENTYRSLSGNNVLYYLSAVRQQKTEQRVEYLHIVRCLVVFPALTSPKS